MKWEATISRRRVQLVVVCLLCLGLGSALHHSDGARKLAPPLTPKLHPIGAPFVIADLDGDRQPDLALVETGSPRSANTNYSIRLQFSTGPESAIGVIAPFGGLRVAARDVNGDDKLDLIVTSNLDAHFIEVLLNDGHGNFSKAAQGAYPGLENEPTAVLNGPAGAMADQTTLASWRSSFGAEGAMCHDYDCGLSGDCFLGAQDQVAPRRAACSRLGRSPPVPVALA